MALRLNELNQERQAIEAGILAAAAEMVPDPPPAALVLSSPAWHEGVVGIVATRIVERFNRPAILLSEGDDEAKGSGRSIPGFDLLGAVERSAEHLLAFGGHRAACGLRLRREHIPAFRAAFVAQAAAMLSAADLVRTQPVDAVVGGHDLTLGLADELELLAPHGFGNRRVTLLLHGAEVVGPRLTRDHRHAQYRVRCEGATCQAIHFNFDKLKELTEPGRFDVPLALSKNEYNGAVSAQVEVKGCIVSSRRGATCAPLPVTFRAPTGSPAAPCGPSCSRVRRGLAARGRAAQGRAACPLRSPRRAGTDALWTVAAAPPSRRSPRWRPAASACWCSSPTSLAAARCSAATCSRRSSRGRRSTCKRRASAGSAKRWPAPTS